MALHLVNNGRCNAQCHAQYVHITQHDNQEIMRGLERGGGGAPAIQWEGPHS